jgi:hypothetical protein
MELLTNRQTDLIVSSLRKVFQTGDTQHLSKSAYNFLYLCSGFIAHYNLYGFRDEYQDVSYLKRMILANVSNNQWNNFRAGERDYDYYMQKRDIYNRIVEEIVKTSDDKETMREKVEELKSPWGGWRTSRDIVLC